jgi:hypothetical protein
VSLNAQQVRISKANGRKARTMALP